MCFSSSAATPHIKKNAIIRDVRVSNQTKLIRALQYEMFVFLKFSFDLIGSPTFFLFYKRNLLVFSVLTMYEVRTWTPWTLQVQPSSTLLLLRKKKIFSGPTWRIVEKTGYLCKQWNPPYWKNKRQTYDLSSINIDKYETLKKSITGLM